MLSGIKQKTIVGKDGKIELPATELLEGTLLVEVIVLVESQTEEGQQPTDKSGA
jgi:antitoxin YefM